MVKLDLPNVAGMIIAHGRYEDVNLSNLACPIAENDPKLFSNENN
jgi:hypothetical protein